MQNNSLTGPAVRLTLIRWEDVETFYDGARLARSAVETNNRKEILYELAVGSAEANELSKAIDMATELANIDFSYRDIGRLLDEWHTRMQQADVSN